MLSCTFTRVLLTLISLIIGAKCKSQLSLEEVRREMLIKFLFKFQKDYLYFNSWDGFSTWDMASLEALVNLSL